MQRIVFAALAVLASAAAVPSARAQTPLFSEDSELNLVIEGPIRGLVARAARNTDPISARLTLGEQSWDIGLEPRGISRRTGGICTFPPLRIDFAEGAVVRDTVFRGQNRLKVVTRCRPGASYEALTVLEYLTYRLHNELTPLSYRVRPARITYRDRRDEVQWNFLIEDVDDLASRNRRVALDVRDDEVSAASLDANATARYALFQFMIGNLDWDMVASHTPEECCHNSRLLGQSAESRQGLIPVPYDFDYSGFVNAPYAIPPEAVPVRTVRQRYYRGYCRFNEQVPGAIAHFQEHRAALLALVNAETRLSEGRRETARRYIEDFFEILDNPREVERQIIDRCR